MPGVGWLVACIEEMRTERGTAMDRTCNRQYVFFLFDLKSQFLKILEELTIYISNVNKMKISKTI